MNEVSYILVKEQLLLILTHTHDIRKSYKIHLLSEKVFINSFMRLIAFSCLTRVYAMVTFKVSKHLRGSRTRRVSRVSCTPE